MKPSKFFNLLATGVALLFAHSAVQADECKELVMGSAISLTGKYATNGVHAMNGYEFAIQKIKDAGGVKIGDA